jgi:hypothetical protein
MKNEDEIRREIEFLRGIPNEHNRIRATALRWVLK